MALCEQPELSSARLSEALRGEDPIVAEGASTLLRQEVQARLAASGAPLSRVNDGDYPPSEPIVTVDEAAGSWTLRSGGQVVTQPIRPEIRLRYAAFDPLKEQPVVPASLKADASSLYIVQFWTAWLESYGHLLAEAGATRLKYLPEQCVIVRTADPAALRELPAVRWVGRYEPAYRVDPALLPLLIDAPALAQSLPAAGAPAEYSLQVFERGERQKKTVAAFITASGGEVTRHTPGGFLLRARLTPAQLRQVLHRDEVQFVDRIEGPPGEDVDLARRLGWADGLEGLTGVTGQGVRAEVMDGSLRTTHADFQNPPPLLHGPISGDQTHGTQVYGLVFSKGVSTPAARGLLPGAEQGIFADYGPLTDRYAHTARLVDPEGPYRAVFQSNSWGNAQTSEYTTISMELDDIAFLHDLVILQSQSNTGTTESRPESWAKNVVSVGAVFHRNTLARDDDCWCLGASIGPAADGRIKPDLCHFGDAVTTSSRASDFAFTTNFSGTSAATPITAGYFGLMFQMWHEGFFSGFGQAESVFRSRPHMTTAKALMINTARQYEFQGQTDDLSRFHQGWGMVSIRSLFDASESALVVDESVALRPFGQVRYNVRVAPGAERFCATMTFADPAGNPAATMHRINDLDLLVIAPDGTSYPGNHGLRGGPYSTPGVEQDRIDTVENVILPDPAPGVYTVVITATSINEDGRPETQALDADFALVVSGISSAGCDADWDRDGAVGLLDLLLFIDAWFSGEGDIDGDGVSNIMDLLAYLDAWFSPCPT